MAQTNLEQRREAEQVGNAIAVMFVLFALISSGCAVVWNNIPLALASVTFAILSKR
jgi:hypothetical protein